MNIPASSPILSVATLKGGLQRITLKNGRTLIGLYVHGASPGQAATSPR
ncbi:hypothetical protein [Nitratireductor luteus]|nr:hypothetical protein [Nitratireductor luteus]